MLYHSRSWLFNSYRRDINRDQTSIRRPRYAGANNCCRASTVTITDVLNRQVEVPAKAKRLLVGFYFEDVFVIGGPNA